MSSADPKLPGLAFIGGGNMARSLIAGLRDQGHSGDGMHVIEPDASTRNALAADFAVHARAEASDAIASARVVVLAVKPQVLADVCASLAPLLDRNNALVISIAAGTRTAQIDQWLGGGFAIVRAMPNTPALLRAGATGLYANARCQADDKALSQRILDAVGLSVWIDDENLMDAVTAVSGSGPAYFFRLIETLQAAGIEQGLDAETARQLVLQTALGAARMAQESGEPASELRRRVTSPGGTTAAAMHALDNNHFDDAVAQAVTAATRRGRELSGMT